MKKINVGIILTVLCILVFAIIIIIDENIKKIEIGKVKKFVNEYLEVCNNYVRLEEEDRDIDKKMNEKKYEEYLSKINLQLDRFILDTKKSYIYTKYKERIDNQYKGLIIYNEYKIDNLYYNDINVNGDIINLKISYDLRVEASKRQNAVFISEFNRYIGVVKDINGIVKLSDNIIIRKYNKNEYKIVYHDVKVITEFPFENSDILFIDM